MEKFKICPTCKKHNDARMMECIYCETSLMGVAVMDERTIHDEEVNSGNNGGPENGDLAGEVVMVRVCEECGTENPANRRVCNSCGEDISDVVLTPSTQCSPQSDHSGCILSSFDGQYAYQLNGESVVLGRTEEMAEYLTNKPYVSRQHAKLSSKDGKLYIQNLSKTNYTFVNNKQISDDSAVELHDGDELALGGNEQNGNRQERAAYFIVRIETCS